MDKRAIGIFDSGIGGLNVLKEYRKALPNEDFIYYADTKNLPYGDKSKKQVIKYCEDITNYFISKDVKAIVIACSTATCFAYSYLKEHFNIPIFNIIKATCKNLSQNQIGLIATKGTVSSHVWENEILKISPNRNIISVACPKLVPLIENGLINSPEAKYAIAEYLSIFKSNKIEALILGCTHYPLFSDLIQEELGSNIELINIGTYSAIEFKDYLMRNDLSNSLSNNGKIKYIVSDNEKKFFENIMNLGLKI